jgi:phospholipase C
LTDQLEQPDGDWSEWDTRPYRDGRLACIYGPGTMPNQSLGDFAKSARSQFPADLWHVIVILRENRSFDHYLGAYPRAQHIPLVEVPNPDPSNGGKPVPRYKTGQYCAQNTDPDHEWTAAHLQYDNGALDGFVAASTRDRTNGGGCVAMGYFDRTDLPLYYWLADHFAINESYFSSLLGPTMANISFYYNATSCGTTENVETTAEDIAHQIVPWYNGCPTRTSIFDLLKTGGHSAKVYNDSTAKADSAAWGLTDYSYDDLGNLDNDFVADLDAEEGSGQPRLADVVFVEPNYGHLDLAKDQVNENDEHPPSNIQKGQLFVFNIINAILSHHTVFSHSVVFITWDENGGFYDHVHPPRACRPDRYVPADFDFERYGFRVPFFAISPWARTNFASSYGSDHTSILRFIEAWKNLPALTARDANAWPLLDMFDFTSTREVDTSDLPEIGEDIARRAKSCLAPEKN